MCFLGEAQRLLGALLANWGSIACHKVMPFGAFVDVYTTVWNTGDILDAIYGHVKVAKCADSSVSTESDAFDKYVNGR